MPLAIEPERDDSSIVLVGSINPAIFQPLWFSNHGLIGKEDAENADLGVVHPDVTQFRAANLRFQVDTGRFVITCETAHRVRLKDLVIECFGNILPHTPIRMIGLNRELHYSCGSLEQRTAFGRRLAPRQPWGEWGALIDKNALEYPDKQGGMALLQMRNSPRDDGKNGYTQFDIRGSQIIKDNAGVYVRANDHFELVEDKDKASAVVAAELIEEVWDASTKRCEDIFDALMRESKT